VKSTLEFDQHSFSIVLHEEYVHNFTVLISLVSTVFV